MDFAPDGRLFVCLQGGQLRVIKNGASVADSVCHLTVTSSGERGLLGVAFDPNFATNNFVYVYYTVTSPPMHNRVSRFTANGDVAVAGSEMVLLDLENLSRPPITMAARSILALTASFMWRLARTRWTELANASLIAWQNAAHQF